MAEINFRELTGYLSPFEIAIKKGAPYAGSKLIPTLHPGYRYRMDKFPDGNQRLTWEPVCTKVPPRDHSGMMPKYSSDSSRDGPAST